MAWADAHHARTGIWPNAYSGPIEDAPGEKWGTIDNALRLGLRGLLIGSSLAVLLADRRGVRNKQDLPRFSTEKILAWADAHHHRTGEWPNVLSGPIEEAPGETWLAVNQALTNGGRGMPGKSSLARLLGDHERVRHYRPLPDLKEGQIAAWADRYYERVGKWPARDSGDIPEEPGETWQSINTALIEGRRGLGGGSSLACLLAEQRNVRNRSRLPALSIEQILRWADAHHRRTGLWPTKQSGTVDESPEETWSGVNAALRKGNRQLPGGSSLANLLDQHRRPEVTKGRSCPLDQLLPEEGQGNRV